MGVRVAPACSSVCLCSCCCAVRLGPLLPSPTPFSPPNLYSCVRPCSKPPRTATSPAPTAGESGSLLCTWDPPSSSVTAGTVCVGSGLVTQRS